MSAAWFRARREIRARWLSMLALTVLVGVLAGGSIAAAADARRTHTAYPRFLERHGVYHANVAAAEKDLDEIARIPLVRALVPTRLFVGRITFDGVSLSFPDVFLVAGITPPGAPNSTKVLEGVQVDQNAVDQVFINYALAERLGIQPGDALTGTIMSPERQEDFRVASPRSPFSLEASRRSPAEDFQT